MSYVLSGCSPADLSAEHFRRREISCVFFHVILGQREILDDLGQTVPMPEFYRAMTEGAETRTSQPSVGDFADVFEPLLKAGQDVLHVSLSSGISGAYSSACQAAEVLRARYPERKLLIVDSLAASSGYGLLLDLMADQRDAGLTIDELADWAERNKRLVHHWFFSSDLTFYIRGGRITKTAGFFCQMLNICPLLNVDREGRLVPRSKIRTKRRVIQEIVDRMEAHAAKGLRYTGKCYISHSDCEEDARAVADLVEARFPGLSGRVLINMIGPTIGAHTGPGTVALFFMGDERKD